jgi:predicted alpha-1,6-mannanase (GH76 family)
MDLRAEDDEIRFHIHNPGASQWIFWVGRPELEASLGGWDWRRAAEIPVSARKTAAPLKVVIKLFADGDEELEVQAGKYWMWLKAADLADALTRLGVRLDRPAA